LQAGQSRLYDFDQLRHPSLFSFYVLDHVNLLLYSPFLQDQSKCYFLYFACLLDVPTTHL
jgi:hypothetical protein